MLHQIIAEVQEYHEQARLIVAGRLLAAVDQYLGSGQHIGRPEVKAALALLRGELKPSFDELRQRAAECALTLDDWHSVSARTVDSPTLCAFLWSVTPSTCPGMYLSHTRVGTAAVLMSRKRTLFAGCW